MRVLVTGGTGFVGRHIAAELIGAGHRVTVLARSSRAGEDGVPAGAAFAPADVCDPASLSAPAARAEAVCHAAGIPRCVRSNPCREAAMHEVNAEGTRNVCRAAALAGVRRVVVVSSIAVYGSDRRKLLVEGDECLPEDGYAVSKLRAEELAAGASAEFGLAVAALRLGPLYGPGHAGNVRRLLEAIERRRFYPLGRGLNRKSLLHVGDAARACRLAVEGQAREQQQFSIYNVAGPPATLREIVARAADELGRRPYRGYFPALPFRLLSDAGLCPRAVERWLADEAIDSSRFRQAFGWRPEVELGDGLREEASRLRSGLARIAWAPGVGR